MLHFLMTTLHRYSTLLRSPLQRVSKGWVAVVKISNLVEESEIIAEE